MATQRLTVATLAGAAAVAVVALFERWHDAPDPAAVDRFCAALRDNGLSLPVVYFTEWADRWLMGDLVPGLGAIQGLQFQTACMSPAEAAAWADQCGRQFAEQEWLAIRLRAAAKAWGSVAERSAVVVIRHVVGPSATDDEVRESLAVVPEWLSLPPNAI